MTTKSYASAHSILKLFEILGWVVVGLGAVLLLFQFFFTASVPYMLDPVNPTVSDRFFALIPGVLFVQAGLIQIVLVKVGMAHIDTAETTKELLKIARQPTAVYVHKGKATSSAPATKPKQKPAQKKPVEASAQAPVQTYKGMPIQHRKNGHFVGEKRFAGEKQARAYIDGLAAA